MVTKLKKEIIDNIASEAFTLVPANDRKNPDAIFKAINFAANKFYEKYDRSNPTSLRGNYVAAATAAFNKRVKQILAEQIKDSARIAIDERHDDELGKNDQYLTPKDFKIYGSRFGKG